MPSAVKVLAAVNAAPFKFTVISSAVPTVAAADIPTVVSALVAVILTAGIDVKPVTLTALSEPLFVTPVMPAINVASRVVAVTALTDMFSIEDPTTPAPYPAVAEVFERESVSDPAPPVKLSPALSV
jgi:hypothetical protein